MDGYKEGPRNTMSQGRRPSRSASGSETTAVVSAHLQHSVDVVRAPRGLLRLAVLRHARRVGHGAFPRPAHCERCEEYGGWGVGGTEAQRHRDGPTVR